MRAVTPMTSIGAVNVSSLFPHLVFMHISALVRGRDARRYGCRPTKLDTLAVGSGLCTMKWVTR